MQTTRIIIKNSFFNEGTNKNGKPYAKLTIQATDGAYYTNFKPTDELKQLLPNSILTVEAEPQPAFKGKIQFSFDKFKIDYASPAKPAGSPPQKESHNPSRLSTKGSGEPGKAIFNRPAISAELPSLPNELTKDEIREFVMDAKAILSDTFGLDGLGVKVDAPAVASIINARLEMNRQRFELSMQKRREAHSELIQRLYAEQDEKKMKAYGKVS